MAKADQAVIDLQKEWAQSLPKTGPLLVASLAPAASKRELLEQLAALEQAAGELRAEQRQHQRWIEDEMRTAGVWVSFSAQIAPILYGNCLPCHNARSAGGGYSLQDYSSLMADGDSGRAIMPGQPDESWLLEQVESGEMPPDAESLPEEEREVLRRWVAAGARLDMEAEPRTSLVQLMPRPMLPAAPATYPVAAAVTALAVGEVDGQPRLASSGYREVLLWSLDGELQQRCGDVLERVYGLSFSPTAPVLAVASGVPGQLGEISLLDAASGGRLQSVLLAEDSFLDVAFSPDGKKLAAAGSDGKIYLFEVEVHREMVVGDVADMPQLAGTQSTPSAKSNIALEVRRLLTIADHADWVNAIAWSHDGLYLASASRDKTAKVFEVATGKSLLTFAEHQANVVDIEFSLAGERLASIAEDGKSLRMWRRSDGKQVREIALNEGESVALKWYQETRLLVVSANGHATAYDTNDGSRQGEARLPRAISKDLPGGSPAPSGVLGELPGGVPSSLVVADRQTFWCGDQAGGIHRLRHPAGELQGNLEVEKSWLAVP